MRMPWVFPWVLAMAAFLAMMGCSEEETSPPLDGDEESSLDGDEESSLEDEQSEDELSEEGEGDGDGDGDVEAAPPMPVALCGMESYELLPRAQVGALLAWEEYPLFDMTPATIDNLMEKSGYTALSPVPYGGKAYRIRYTTQDKGESVEATAVVAVPANAEGIEDKSFPYALFLHGTTGFSDPCAPSRRDDGPAQGVLLAALGFITVLPDYIGLAGFGEPSTAHHGYLVGEQTAIGSWDALRAAEVFLSEQLADEVHANGQTVVWGGSQGGHAAMVTELYGPYYAPEYDVKAVVSLIPPLTLHPLAEAGLTTFSPPTVAFLAVLTTMRAWYGAPGSMAGVLTNTEPYFLAENAEEYVFVEEECNAGDDLEASTLEEIYAAEFITAVRAGDWESLEPWNCYLSENDLTLTSVAPLRQTPTLAVFSELDDLVITAPQREAYDALCEAGYQMEYIECTAAGHSEGAVWSLPEQLDWIRARLAGEPIATERLCTRGAPVCCSATPEEKCAAE
ncbi:MAG: hypothetical protein C4523_09755 [Myxococcales bacterium]|nr:MAG: hypothetical protein C4523_09755 [Myxococcales bacterium]